MAPCCTICRHASVIPPILKQDWWSVAQCKSQSKAGVNPILAKEIIFHSALPPLQSSTILRRSQRSADWDRFLERTEAGTSKACLVLIPVDCILHSSLRTWSPVLRVRYLLRRHLDSSIAGRSRSRWVVAWAVNTCGSFWRQHGLDRSLIFLHYGGV